MRGAALISSVDQQSPPFLRYASDLLYLVVLYRFDNVRKMKKEPWSCRNSVQHLFRISQPRNNKKLPRSGRNEL
jgi:hypothetical protein